MNELIIKNTKMTQEQENQIDETINYLINESLDSLSQILSDPVNVIMESELDFSNDDYDEALEYVSNWTKD